MRRLLILAALASATAASAQTRQVRLDVSPAGQAVVKKYLGTPDAGVRPLAEQLTAVAREMSTIADGPRLDLKRVDALMRRQESLQAQMQRRSNARTLQMLTELPEPDRIKFLRGMKAARPGPAPAK